MKKKLIAVTLLANAVPSAFPASYQLSDKETVSELLYRRLNIKPIYRNGYLNKVLEYNGLTDAKAQKLPVGFVINLPEENVAVEEPYKSDEVAPEVVSPEVEEPAVLETMEVDQRIGVGFFLDQQKGEGQNNDSKSNITMGRPGVTYEVKATRSKHELWGRLGASYLTLTSDPHRKGGDQFFLGESILQYSYDVADVASLGLRGKYSQDIYLSEAGTESYKISNPWIYGIGPVLTLGENRHWQLAYLIIPEQSVKDSLKSKNNYDLKLTYETLFLQNPIRFGAHYGDNSTKEMKGTRTGVSAEYFFDF